MIKMAKKEFMFHGKTLEELQSMSNEEFAHYLDAQKRRSIQNGFTEAQKRFLKKLEKKNDNVKTHCRNMVILPRMVGKTILVHNGKTFEQVRVVEEMLGHRLGEFVFTRKRLAHSAPGVGATKSSGAVSVK